jgi:hypothetical protein
VVLLKENASIKWDKSIKKNVFKTIKHVLGCVHTDDDRGIIFGQFHEIFLTYINQYLNVNNCEESWFGIKKINGCLEKFKQPKLAPEFIAEFINTLTLAQ